MKNRVQRLIITTNRLQIWTKIPKNISKYLNPLIQFIFASITLPITCLAPFCNVKFLQTRLYTVSCFSSNTICSSFFSPFKHEQLPVMSPMCCGQVSTDQVTHHNQMKMLYFISTLLIDFLTRGGTIHLQCAQKHRWGEGGSVNIKKVESKSVQKILKRIEYLNCMSIDH